MAERNPLIQDLKIDFMHIQDADADNYTSPV